MALKYALSFVLIQNVHTRKYQQKDEKFYSPTGIQSDKIASKGILFTEDKRLFKGI
jgi:hypothetical protein